MNISRRLLLVGGTRAEAARILSTIAPSGWELTHAHTESEALAAARTASPPTVWVVVADQTEPSAAACMAAAARAAAPVSVVVATPVEAEATALAWIDLGAAGWVLWPDPAALGLALATLRRLDDRHRVREGELAAQARVEERRHRRDAVLAEARKTEALARLAAHVGHELNNWLTIVYAHASHLETIAPPGPELGAALQQAANRVRELTQQLASFCERPAPEPRPVDLEPLVSETLQLLAPRGTSVTMRQVKSTPSARALGDAAQLRLLLLHLATNALQAMPEGGDLTIALETRPVDEAFAAAHPPLVVGNWVLASVLDSGRGMDEAKRQRAIEPYFTTSTDRSGAGLGLAVANAIVTAHGGAISVESQEGRGTRVDVYLPSADAPVQRGAGQHVMVVDDHPGMAKVSARLLEALGYRSSAYESPRQALEAFRKAPGAIEAVLTDLAMPEMSGEELARSVHAVRAGLPVIASTGRGSQLDSEHLRRHGFSAVLVKPWRVEDALAVLHRVLPPPRS